MKRRLSSAPVFLQVIGLALAAIVAAQGITIALLVFAPAPPAVGFSIQDAARALKGEAVKLPDGSRLRAQILPRPPAFADADGHVARVIAAVLARSLHAAPGDVRAELRVGGGLGGGAARYVMHIRRAHSEQMRIVVAAGAAMPPDDGDMATLASDSLVFPPFAAAWRQADGRWRVIDPERPILTSWHARMLIGLGLAVLLLTPLAWLLARRLTAPIRAFAEAAERLGADPNAPPLVASGPSEVRMATAAFNDMQDKLRQYVEGRTAMLAAIAHDLKTPLTRMRFRADAAPSELRDKLAADVAEMDAMIAAVLAYVRGAGGRQAHGLLDLAALLEAVAQDFADTGARLTVGELQSARVRGDTLALRRLFANLVQNAVKFAGAAEVSLTAADGWAQARIEDRGPGLAEADLEQAFEPFHRGEPSRSRDTGGVGLGLPIARAIAREHGGEVTLERRPGGGLSAVVRLPSG